MPNKPDQTLTYYLKLLTGSLLKLSPGAIIKGGNIFLLSGWEITENTTIATPTILWDPIPNPHEYSIGVIGVKQIVIESKKTTNNSSGSLIEEYTQDIIGYSNSKPLVAINKEGELHFIVQAPKYLLGITHIELEWEPAVKKTPTRAILQVS